MDLCDEMRALRLNPTKEGYAFIATVAIKDGKTYLVSRTLETMQQEGFAAEVCAYRTVRTPCLFCRCGDVVLGLLSPVAACAPPPQSPKLTPRI